jgi:hypothetical protein
VRTGCQEEQVGLFTILRCDTNLLLRSKCRGWTQERSWIVMRFTERHLYRAVAELDRLQMRRRGEAGPPQVQGQSDPGGLAARDYYETKPTSAAFSADGLNGGQELGRRSFYRGRNGQPDPS